LIRRTLTALAVVGLAVLPAFARSPGPQPLPMTPAIPAPRDIPYPGTLKLHVDLTDIDHRIFTVRETIPVAGPGPMVLRYPEWLPGKHAPRGAIERVAGIVITAGGKPVRWRRDDVDMFAFHVDVP
jgi:hypothetical protein